MAIALNKGGETVYISNKTVDIRPRKYYRCAIIIATAGALHSWTLPVYN